MTWASCSEDLPWALIHPLLRVSRGAPLVALFATGGQASRIPADSTKCPFSVEDPRGAGSSVRESHDSATSSSQTRDLGPQKLIADESLRVSIDEAPHDVRNLVLFPTGDVHSLAERSRNLLCGLG